jgi:hypothetical protein
VLEYAEALDKWAKSPSAFPLIVILLEGQTAPGLPFLRQLHWIITSDPSSEKDVGRLFDAAFGGGSSRSDLWRYTSPYRGLAAMEEKYSDYFFGRKRETVDVLSALAGAPDRLPLLIGNSGVPRWRKHTRCVGSPRCARSLSVRSFAVMTTTGMSCRSGRVRSSSRKRTAAAVGQT